MLKEVEGAKKLMVDEMVEAILKENLPTTRKRLHERFYSYYRRKYPGLPLRVIEGAYIIAGRMVKGFRERRRKGLVKKERPEYRRVVIVYPNKINWKFNRVSVSVLTYRG